jgi:hypothetical protein
VPGNLNLPKQTHNLLRRMLLSSRHSRLLSYQFLALMLVQKLPGTPEFYTDDLRQCEGLGGCCQQHHAV